MSIEELKSHIDKFFSDTSRNPSQTRADLEEARDHVEILIETLPRED